MRIREILRVKGDAVTTILPTISVRQLLAVLAEHNIGAVVVSEDGVSIAGIVSERDVVRGLHERGPELLDDVAASIMTSDVLTCTAEDKIDDLQHTMTDHRIRHLPVLREGQLAGIVSIGDVVKNAISELETERAHLVDYIQG